VLAHDELVVLVQRGDIADNRTIKVRSRELGFKFRFERALFAALELPRRERIRIVIALWSIASWAPRTRVSRRTWPATVLGPGLALAIASGTCRAVARFSIAGPRLTFAIRRLTVARPRFTLAITSGTCRTVPRFTIARPRLALAITRRACRAVTRLGIARPRLAFAVASGSCRTVARFSIAAPWFALSISRFTIARPRLALAVARRSTSTGRTS
jgi:hypothetical protein